MSRRKVASIAFTGVAAAGAVGLTAPGAFASTGWHVHNNAGAKITANTKFTAKNISSATPFTTNGITLKCPKSTASMKGTFLKSPPVSGGGNRVASVSVLNFGVPTKACAFGSNTFSANLVAGHTLKLIASTFKSSFKRIVNGELTGAISETIHGSTLFGACTITISGASPVSASYNNGTHRLTLNPNPRNVSTFRVKANTCPLVQQGKPAKFGKVEYAITAPASLTQATLNIP